MRKTLLGIAAAACLVPALALAADPKPNSHFTYCASQSKCPLSFNTNRGGGKITRLVVYDKCSDVPVGEKGFYPAIPVNGEGKFSTEGTVVNMIGETVEYEFRGRFKKPGKAVGTYRLTTSECTDPKHDFVAKRDGEAQQGF